MAYDSTVDAKNHIEKIQKVFNDLIIPELKKRSENHDKSKLESPEKDAYDQMIPELKATEYGSKEYNEVKKKYEEGGFGHHIKNNSHHPEHYENGINDMDLFDIVEMFADHYAASLNSDTGYPKGLELNKKRFNMSDNLYNIYLNTYNRYLK